MSTENHTHTNADEQHRVETFGPLEPGYHTDPLLAARGARYGAFSANARVSQSFKALMRAAPKWDTLDPDMKEALETIALKISRILCGDPQYDDSWVDIAGYATRVADRLRIPKASSGEA